MHLYLAQAHFRLEQFRETLAALAGAGEAGDSIAAVHELRGPGALAGSTSRSGPSPRSISGAARLPRRTPASCAARCST
ncbi:MAG: hypothetical protein U5K33_07985 [Halofilum sp. (in: g-proteobacteria)]|nr:hypothetical protein [Halofilum sp. (in: g-proteobacteria)]